jgi:hypothetical protein
VGTAVVSDIRGVTWISAGSRSKNEVGVNVGFGVYVGVGVSVGVGVDEGVGVADGVGVRVDVGVGHGVEDAAASARLATARIVAGPGVAQLVDSGVRTGGVRLGGAIPEENASIALNTTPQPMIKAVRKTQAASTVSPPAMTG